MTSLSDVKQAEIIEAFKSTSRYLDDLLNIDNPYFEGMVKRIYPPELQLNKANTADTEAPFLDLHLSISNGFVSSKIYDKRDDFDFDIVNFPFLDGDVPRSTSYGVYISQLIRFARVFWMGGKIPRLGYLAPPGVKIPRAGGKIPRDIFTPGGQAAQGGKINCYSTNCAPLVADLFLFCYERDFMTSLSDVKHLNLHLDIWTTF